MYCVRRRGYRVIKSSEFPHSYSVIFSCPEWRNWVSFFDFRIEFSILIHHVLVSVAITQEDERLKAPRLDDATLDSRIVFFICFQNNKTHLLLWRSLSRSRRRVRNWRKEGDILKAYRTFGLSTSMTQAKGTFQEMKATLLKGCFHSAGFLITQYSKEIGLSGLM